MSLELRAERQTRIPIAEHNAAMDAFMAKWFSPDPDRTPRGFYFSEEHKCWLVAHEAMPTPALPGWLNYDGKHEFVRRPDGTVLCLVRRDMTDDEFAALPPLEEQAR